MTTSQPTLTLKLSRIMTLSITETEDGNRGEVEFCCWSTWSVHAKKMCIACYLLILLLE